MARKRNDGERDYVAIGRKYAQDVVAGKIPACRWVKLACQRQLDDLKRNDWPYRFDRERAWKICYFIEQLPHIKGRWKTRNIVLEPWQCFHLAVIFGWVDANGNRRFRKALIVVPRKNAKTTEAAGVGLYMLGPDGEPGAEVYSAATTRDQAKISWDTARQMARRSPGFCSKYGIEPLAHSIAIDSESSFFKPLSRDADSLEGLNPHGAIIDELHAHKTREVFDVLDEATGARQQPLIFIISTEGDNPAGIFAEQVAYAEHVLEGRHQDESYFAIVYTIDAEDDWVAPASWRKANPNLGVSVSEQDMEIRCRQAQKNAASQSSFLTKRLNVRVGASEAYFNMLAWRSICRNPNLEIENFHGRVCYGGLDLASKFDVAAKILLFPFGEKCAVFGKYYLPEECLERGNPNFDVYRGWAESGVLTLTPGNVIDFEFIERDLLEDFNTFDLQEVAFDPHQATELSTRMQAEGLTMVEIPQSVSRLSEPMKSLAGLITGGTIQHAGDPMLDWMMGNVAPKYNAREDVFPTKGRPENKIDGALALIMANSRMILSTDTEIDYRGLRSVG